MDIFLVPLKFSNTFLLKNIRDFLLKTFPSKVHIINLDIEVDSAFIKGRGQYYSTQIIAEALKLSGALEG